MMLGKTVKKSTSQWAKVSLLALMGAVLATHSMAESLKDAIALAYSQNPNISRERALQRANDEQLVKARSRMGPTVTVGGAVNYQDTPAPYYGRSSTGLNVNAEQVLFTSGGLTASVDATKASVLAGQQSLKSAENELVFNVVSIYTAVRRDQEALLIAQENYNVLKRQLDETKAMFDAGQLTRTDVAQSEARLAASEAYLASARAQLDTDRAAYRALVGQAPVSLEPEPALPALPNSYEAALAQAEANNPDLQAAMLAEDSANAQLRAAKSAYGPSVSLSASGANSAPTSRLGDLDANKSATASVRFSVPLYSSGANASGVRAAQENVFAARQTVEIARRGITQTLSQAWSQMLAAKAATEANEQQVRAAQIAAEGVRTEYQVGLRTNIEVLNAEQELRSAQLSLLDARRAHYLATARVLVVTGGLTAKTMVPDIEEYDPMANFKKAERAGWSPFEPVVRTLDGAAQKVTGKN